MRTLNADIVIVGLGAAGISAAIRSLNFGASVVVLERMPPALAGGNTRVSAESMLTTFEPADLSRYLFALAGGLSHLTRSDMERWAEKAANIPAWLHKSGVKLSKNGLTPMAAEWPDLPGAEAVAKVTVANPGRGEMWRSLVTRAVARGAHVEYGTQVIQLLRDRSNLDVTGVEAIDDRGSRVVCHSRLGVILCAGGHAGAGPLLKRLSPHAAGSSAVGSPFSDGTTMRLASQCGAALSKTSATCGPYLSFHPPGYRTAVAVQAMQMSDWKGFCVVDRHGAIYDRHRLIGKHGYRNTQSGFIPLSLPPLSSLVFGEYLMNRGPLIQTGADVYAPGWCRRIEGLSWSENNQKEIKPGWIEPIDQMVERTAFRRGQNLLEDVAKYIGERPRFSLPLRPAILNTQGGPLRDVHGRAIARSGALISGLAVAGEAGSIFTRMYQGSGNLSDCFVSGWSAADSLRAISNNR